MTSLAKEVYVMQTPVCWHCNKSGTVEMTLTELMTYELGGLLQEAFPNHPAPVREQIKTGVHPKCWEEMFGQGHDG